MYKISDTGKIKKYIFHNFTTASVKPVNYFKIKMFNNNYVLTEKLQKNIFHRKFKFIYYLNKLFVN